MEVVGRIWASYWLLICASFLVVASVVPTWRGGHWCTGWNAWLKFPYSFNVGGWEFPVQSIVPHHHEFSYGLCGIAVLAVAFYFRKRFRWSLLLGAAMLLTLWIIVPGRMTSYQAAMLRRLNEENQAVPVVKAFTRSFLPGEWRFNQGDPKALRRGYSSRAICGVALYPRTGLVLLWPWLISTGLLCG